MLGRLWSILIGPFLLSGMVIVAILHDLLVKSKDGLEKAGGVLRRLLKKIG